MGRDVSILHRSGPSWPEGNWHNYKSSKHLVRSLIRGRGLAIGTASYGGPVNRTLFRASCLGICLAFCGSTLRATDEPKQSIREFVHENGAFESITVWPDSQLTLADLAGQAELVVEASTLVRRTLLDESQTQIVTDYAFNIHQIIKNRRRHEIRAGSVITVRRESGSIDFDGRPAVAVESGFREFDARERYILFLKQWPGTNAFEVLGGPQGAFTSDDNVLCLAGGQAQPRSGFLGEVRALLKFTE
jgi:hypothetical protein